MEYITITGRIKEIYGLARIASGLCGAPSFIIKLGHVSDCLILSNHDHGHPLTGEVVVETKLDSSEAWEIHNGLRHGEIVEGEVYQFWCHIDQKSRANIIDSFEWVRTEGVMSIWSNN